MEKRDHLDDRETYCPMCPEHKTETKREKEKEEKKKRKLSWEKRPKGTEIPMGKGKKIPKLCQSCREETKKLLADFNKGRDEKKIKKWSDRGDDP